VGERLYREGDRLGALETWRAIPENSSDYSESRERITVLEEEFKRLVVRYKQRGRYFETKGRLAESILNYRLSLKLQPDDAVILSHVQQLARKLAARKKEREEAYRAAFDGSDLAAANRALEELRKLDPFDSQLETEERRLLEALRAEVNHQLAAGRHAFTAGRYASAEGPFRAVLALDPSNESARGYLSYIATIRRESERSPEQPAAFGAAETFASDAEIRAEGFYQNALAAERGGDLYVAIRHDLRALEAHPEHDGARRHLETTRGKLARGVGSLIESGRDAFRNEDLQSALDLWRRALLVDPDNERARAYVARAERQLENLERLRGEPEVSSKGR
jgi:tetratricopeptide (TPR) repeat protein